MTDKVKEAAERLGAFAIGPTFPQGLKADINTVLSALRERGEALEKIRAEVPCAKHYAESEGLDGGSFPSSVHIKLDQIDGYAKEGLGQ